MKKSLVWNTMFIGPFTALGKNYVKELQIKAKTKKFKIPLVLAFYLPGQNVPPGIARLTTDTLEWFHWCQVLHWQLIHLRGKAEMTHLQLTVLSTCLRSSGNRWNCNSKCHIYTLPSGVKTWPDQWNKLHWGNRVQWWRRMGRGGVPLTTEENLGCLWSLSFSFQFH